MSELWKCWEGKCVSEGLLNGSGRMKREKKQNSSPELQLCDVLMIQSYPGSVTDGFLNSTYHTNHVCLVIHDF